MNRSTGSRPRPSDFALGSAESRAAARMQLAQLLDNRDWLTLYSESDGDRISFGPWKDSPDRSIVMRQALLPTVWATLPINAFPVCPDCGVPFAENGRFETTVCLQPTCADKHDSDPPPRNRGRWDAGYCVSDAEKRRAGQTIAKIRCFETEDAIRT